MMVTNAVSHARRFINNRRCHFFSKVMSVSQDATHLIYINMVVPHICPFLFMSCRGKNVLLFIYDS